MSGLKTVSWLKTVLRRFSLCLGCGLGLQSWCHSLGLGLEGWCLGLAVSVMVFTVTIAKAGDTKPYCNTNVRLPPTRSWQTVSFSPEVTLVKYVAATNHDNFYADNRTNMFASREYAVIKPLFCRPLSVPASSAPVERVFHREGSLWDHMVPRWEMRCWNW